MKFIGNCKDCKYRNTARECENPKLHESSCCEDKVCIGREAKKDHLVYSYSEGGGFSVGDLFGCVHFEEDKTNGIPD